MNTIDYLLLAALAGGAIYTLYRLFLGYVSSRFRDVEVADDNDHPITSQTADNTVANSQTASHERNGDRARGVARRAF